MIEHALSSEGEINPLEQTQIDGQISLDIDDARSETLVVEEDQFIYDSLRSYLSAYRTARSEAKKRSEETESVHQDSVSERIRVRVETGGNLDTPEARTKSQEKRANKSESLLSQRAHLKKELRSLTATKLPPELKFSPLGVKNQKQLDKLNKKLNKVERKLRKKITTQRTHTADTFVQPKAEVYEQPGLRFPVEGVVFYSKGELINSDSNPGKVFAGNLSDSERYKLDQQAIREHKAKQTADRFSKLEARKKTQPEKTTDSKAAFDLRAVAKEHHHYFNQATLDTIDAAIGYVMDNTLRSLPSGTDLTSEQKESIRINVIKHEIGDDSIDTDLVLAIKDAIWSSKKSKSKKA